MPMFRYKAATRRGETLQGEMEARSVAEVISKLQEAGNIPIKAEPVGEGDALGLQALLSMGKGPSQRDIGVFTRQLATLLNAGLPLDRGMNVLHELTESPKMAQVLDRLRESVREGVALSEAMESQHGVFSKLYINMVRAGELGGSLEVALDRLADYMERAKALRDSVVSAMIYPAILMTLAGGSLVILMVYVIPQFEAMFAELGDDIPFITQVTLAAGHVLQFYWWALLAGVLGVVLWFRAQLAKPESRYKWHRRFLDAPVIGQLVRKMETARLARTLGTLLVNGVPLLGSLSIAAKVMGNAVLIEDVQIAAKEVKTGGGLSRTLARQGNFPKMALQMISVGEETGELDNMLMKVADTYDYEVRTAVDRAMAMLVPALTLLMAFLIGGIVISVLMAILSVNDLVV
jgi:general secretion pathway protein F